MNYLQEHSLTLSRVILEAEAICHQYVRFLSELQLICSIDAFNIE